MPGAVPGAGPGQLTHTLRFQVLRVGFEIAVSDCAIARAVRFLVQSAIQPEPARTTVAFDVLRGRDGYEILRDAALVDVQFDPMQVVDSLYRRIQRDALEAWPEAVTIKAVSGSHHGERFLVVGESLAERAWLGLELLCRGADVQGDGLAILDGEQLIAVPWPLRVAGRSAPLPPGAPSLAELPVLGPSASNVSWALDLGATGREWRITPGRCDVILELETNYGGQSRISEVPRRDMARRLISRCQGLRSPVSAIRSIAGLVDGARCYALRLGRFSDVTEFWPRRST